jgi:TolB-like protein
MINQIRFSLMVLFLALVQGCDFFPDYELDLINRQNAEERAKIKALHTNIKKAESDAKISETKLESTKLDKEIQHEIELNEIIHQRVIAEQRSRDEWLRIARDSGIVISLRGTNIKEANYAAADSLIGNLDWNLFWGKNPVSGKFKEPKVVFSKKAPILVASFVNLDNLNESSTFGRVTAEQFASRFNQKDFVTLEVKLGSVMFVKEGSGEFILSREMREISVKHQAQAALVGNYTVAAERIYLTARIVNVDDGRVLASHDYSVPINLDTFKLLLKDTNKAIPSWF